MGGSVMGITDVLLLLRIAETMSFKEAARHLNMSRAQASKRIAALEDELGILLIYRSPRSISLTTAGETLLQYYRRIFDMIHEAKLAVEHLNHAPVGRLRFSMPTCLGAHLLPKLYGEFLPRYPGLVLDAYTSETCVDIVAGGYDIVIRVAQRLVDSTLTAQRLASSPLVVAASPGYLREHGVPTHPSELARHRCLVPCRPRQHGVVWQFRTATERLNAPITPWAISDTNLALAHAARSGLGFVYMPKAVIAADLAEGTLQAVLPEFCRGITWGIYAVYSGRTPTRNAAAMIEFLRDTLPTFAGIECRPQSPVTR